MINILFCSDDKYAPKLAVALSSLLDSNRKIKEQLNIIIRTNDMTEKTTCSLQNIALKFGLDKAQIKFIYTDGLCERLEEEKVKKFKNSYLCYFKLFGLDELLDYNKKERLLVIDCDTIICDLLLELYNYDLQGKAVGAVREFPTNRAAQEYNTGVLLYDMEKYSEFHLEKRMKEVIKSIPDDKWETGDQTVFTVALEKTGLVETLPLKYNFIANQFYFSYREFAYIRSIKCNYYGEKEYEQARKHPCIIHLIYSEFIVQPWYYEGNQTIKKIWDDYLEKTDWKDNKEVYVHLPFKSRIRSWTGRLIHSCMPHNISMRIFRKLF